MGYGYYYWSSASLVSFLQDVCGLALDPEIDARARIIQTLGETCWWYWPGTTFVIVAPRPLILERDKAGKLMCAVWADGWAVERQDDGSYRQNCDVTKVLRELVTLYEPTKATKRVTNKTRSKR